MKNLERAQQIPVAQALIDNIDLQTRSLPTASPEDIETAAKTIAAQINRLHAELGSQQAPTAAELQRIGSLLDRFQARLNQQQQQNLRGLEALDLSTPTYQVGAETMGSGSAIASVRRTSLHA